MLFQILFEMAPTCHRLVLWPTLSEVRLQFTWR